MAADLEAGLAITKSNLGSEAVTRQLTLSGAEE